MLFIFVISFQVTTVTIQRQSDNLEWQYRALLAVRASRGKSMAQDIYPAAGYIVTAKKSIDQMTE